MAEVHSGVCITLIIAGWMKIDACGMSLSPIIVLSPQI